MSDATGTTTEDAPAALPGDGLREGIVDELRRRLGDSLLDVELRPNDDLWVRIATSAWVEAGEALVDMGFAYFCYLSAIDWLPSPYGRGEDNPDEPAPERSTDIVQGVAGGATRLQILARVTDIARHVGVTLKADVPDDEPSIASWHAIYAGANWHERETHEMFGIGFAGHPDLRNMYLPGEFEGYPLRKDFPLLARMVKPWPGIVDVEPMPAQDAPAQDDVVGDVAPESATPEQADGGLGEAPAEDVADEAAAETSPEEAPDPSSPPAAPVTAEAPEATIDPTPQDPPPAEAPPEDPTPQDPPPPEAPPEDPTPQDPPPAEAPPEDPTPQDPPPAEDGVR